MRASHYSALLGFLVCFGSSLHPATLYPRGSTEWSARVFHDVQTGAAPIRAVRDSILVDEDIGGVQHHRPVGPRIHQLLRRGRNAGTDLYGLVGVADVIDANPGVLVGGENQFGALKAARAVLVHVVRP